MLKSVEKPGVSGTLTANAAIEVRDLYKTYPDKKAIDGVSFAVLQGEIFGILGPNGAGKTTTLEIIEGLREPDNRKDTSVNVAGLNVLNKRECAELHHLIGLQLQTSALFDELTVRENLSMLAMLYRKPKGVKQLLKEFDLEEKANALLSTLSGGQKQRVALAAALINDPTILFLDEPTTALDPQARRNVWDTVQEFRQNGKTIVLTTHYMEEAESICDRVAIMDNGKLVALGTPAQLIQNHASEQVITCRFGENSNPKLSVEMLHTLPEISKVIPVAHGYTLYTRDLTHSLPALLHLAQQNEVALTELVTHSPSLEDVFINLTGKALRD